MLYTVAKCHRIGKSLVKVVRISYVCDQNGDRKVAIFVV